MCPSLGEHGRAPDQQTFRAAVSLRGRAKRSLAGGLLALAALTVPTLPTGSGPAAAVGAAPPVFHPMPCPDGAFPADRDVDCGYIVVPEDRHEPDGRTIRVAAAVVHATVPDPAEPIVFVDGGPSFGAISDFALGAYFADWPEADEHDLVLVDTRGTGTSRPRLGCRELDRANVRAFYAGRFVNDDAPRITGHALDRCWQRFTDRGIDLSAYSSQQSASDLEALRHALGYDQWNLLAVSADGTLGLTYQRLYPEGIRSVILDSAMASNADWGIDYLVGAVRVLNRVFAGCRADDACRAAYPHLRRRFEARARQLNDHPVLVRLPHMQPEPVNLLIDGAGLYSDALSFVYPGDLFTPSLMSDVYDYAQTMIDGDLERFYRRLLGTGPIENDHRNDFLPDGKTMSYVCRDYIRFITHDDRVAAAEAAPAFAERFLRRGFDLAAGYNDPVSPAGCRHWRNGRAGPLQHELVESDIPTLVFANTFDLGVPPRMVRPMLPGLSRSTYVELPAGFHLSLAFYTNGSDCAREVATAFLDAPDLEPDTSCVADLPGVDFSPRAQARPRAPLCSPSAWRGSEPCWRASAVRRTVR